jgi:hypothetical protein
MKDFETELKTLIGFVAKTSPLKNEFTQDYIDGLVWGLQGYTIPEIKKALLIHVRKSKFLPAICDIANIIDGCQAQKEADLKVEAEEQAMEVWERLCCRGGIVLEMTDRATATMESMGGWRANGQTLESDGKWWRKKFADLYAGMSEEKKDDILRISNSSVQRISDRTGGAVGAFEIKELPFTDWDGE